MEDLVHKALSGDDHAWQHLVERHNPCVVAALLARGARLELAQEAAQECWALLWERSRSGKLARLELPGLAIRQAQFLLRSGLRKSQRQAALQPAPARAVHHPTESLEARRRLARIQAQVSGWAERDQRLFHLVYAQGYSHQQAAEHLGLSTQRVRQRLCELRRMIRESGDPQ